MAQLVAPLAHFARALEQPVHRALRAEIGPFIEQRGVDRRRRLIDEALAVQGRPAPPAFPRRRARVGCCARSGSGAGAACARLRLRYSVARATPSAAQVGCVPLLGESCSTACIRRSRRRLELLSGISSSREAFFWMSKSSSACSSLRSRRRLSRSSSATRFASGFTAFALRPRRLPDRPASSPRSRWRRQVIRCEEYSPSRLQQRPDLPGALAAAASRRMRRLYSARELAPLRLCRHLRIGAPRPRSPPPSRAGETPLALRAPCVSPAPTACLHPSCPSVPSSSPAPSTLISRKAGVSLILAERAGPCLDRGGQSLQKRIDFGHVPLPGRRAPKQANNLLDRLGGHR